MQHPTKYLFVLLLPLLEPACGLYDSCECANTECTILDCSGADDEAGSGQFSEACGMVLMPDYSVITSHDSCSDVVAQIVSEFGVVPLAYDLQPEDCGDIPVTDQWECFAERELHDQGDGISPPVMCGFCPEFVGETTPKLCWEHPDYWEPATLGGALTQAGNDCEEIEAEIGQPNGYTLPLEGPNVGNDCHGAGITCLGGTDRCSCDCRSRGPISYGEDVGWAAVAPPAGLNDMISWWWSIGYPGLPPLDGYDLPVEVTCSGEPLIFDPEAYAGAGGWVGSTAELDGYEPADPPNGEFIHTPVWELLAGETSTTMPSGFDPRLSANLYVSPEFLAAAMLWPTDLLKGGHATPTMRGSSPIFTVDLCDEGSFCALAGLRVGDVVTGWTTDLSAQRITLDRDGQAPVAIQVVQ